MALSITKDTFNAEQAGNRLVVILNDNDMSIAPPVGGLSAYLAKIVSSRPFLELREVARKLSRRLPEPLREVSFLAPGALHTETQGLTVTWVLPDLAPGEGGAITITARLAPRLIGTLHNRAEISTASPEASLANNVALLDTYVWGALHLPILRK